MPPPNFTELVTTRRNAYFESIDRQKQAGEDIEPGERYQHEFAREHNVLPIGMEYFVEYYLHPDGRLIRYSTFVEEVDAINDDEWSLAYGLRIGSKKYPEFAALIPPRPENATTCSSCKGTGQVIDKEGWNACWHCFGLGWLPQGLEGLIQQTSDAFRGAGESRDENVALVHRFIESATAILGPRAPLVNLLDDILRKADFAFGRRQSVEDILDELTRKPATDD